MFAADFRSIDGTGNNIAHPEWGSTNEQLIRVAPAEYGDGISTPAGADRPNARVISNAIVAHDEEDVHTDRQLSAYSYVWGQFLDHDMDLTEPPAAGREAFNIPVPAGDEFFDPNGTGAQVIPLSRSRFDPATGTSSNNPRQQINQITAWIDGSMIYGSDEARAMALRTGVGGKLLVSSSPTGDLLPFNTMGLENENRTRLPADRLFVAGDIRSNENIELTSIHTLFLREHNRLADEIAASDPTLSDEEIYQRARRIVGAEIQAITYNQWLPSLIGQGALRSYRGYNPRVNAQIANEFSTASFRLHSLINNDIEFFGNDGRVVRDEIELREGFGNPDLVVQEGIDTILKYVASAQSEEVDNQLVDGLRNFLFGEPGQGGLDLASLNIQRGRDHGLADYNRVRVAYGLSPVRRFSDITDDVEVQETLRELYGNVNNIDLWVGGLAEDHLPGSSFGPLIQRVLIDQFERLRDGDRFWYERVFSGRQLDQLRRTTLADIIERNTTVEGLQDNVFFMRAEARGQVFFDRNGDGDHDRDEFGLRGIRVELLDDEGAVIATRRTDFSGRFRFDEFDETGDFAVRIVVPSSLNVTSENPVEILISTGDQTVNGVNFGVRLARRSSSRANDFAEIQGSL